MPVEGGGKLSMEESRLRDERRAKMAALTRDMDPTATFGTLETCTSAPSVRKVGEFHDSYGIADQKSGAETPRAPLPRDSLGRGERIGHRIHVSIMQSEKKFCQIISKEHQLFFSSLAFPSALTLGTEGDLPGIVTWRAFTTPGTGAPITGPP